MDAAKLNRTLFIRDNLEILRGIQDKSIDLIYLDPPFNSNRNYGVPIGGRQAGFHFKDMWNLQDNKEEWYGELSDKHQGLYEIIHAVGCINGNSHKAYLIYMAIRVIEMYRVLKDTGSIYLHCDQTMSHSLKLIMDAIFGKKNFKNHIIWKKNQPKGARSIAKHFGRQTDHILFYTKKYNQSNFNNDYKPIDLESKNNKFKHKDEDGRIYSRDCPLGDYSEENIKKFEKEGRIYTTRTGKKQLIRYLDEVKGIPVTDFWDDVSPINQVAHERTGYSTQKPLTLF